MRLWIAFLACIRIFLVITWQPWYYLYPPQRKFQLWPYFQKMGGRHFENRCFSSDRLLISTCKLFDRFGWSGPLSSQRLFYRNEKKKIVSPSGRKSAKSNLEPPPMLSYSDSLRIPFTTTECTLHMPHIPNYIRLLAKSQRPYANIPQGYRKSTKSAGQAEPKILNASRPYGGPFHASACRLELRFSEISSTQNTPYLGPQLVLGPPKIIRNWPTWGLARWFRRHL